MGNSVNSSSICSDLNKYSDGCQIYKCVDKVVGLSSNSSSPSDTWILTFNKGTRYSDTPIEKGFLKWWIVNFEQENVGLDYEIDVYKQIAPLIIKNINPNFALYLASGDVCTFDNVLDILLKNTGNKQLMKEQLLRNLKFMVEMERNRPSIQNKYIDFMLNEEDARTLKYNFLIIKTFTDGHKTFSEFMHGKEDDDGIMVSKPVGLTNKIINEDGWNILLQISFACYAMELLLITHNDLHHENVMIERLDTEQEMLYIVDNNPYYFKTHWIAKVFDFDRSYSDILGFNKGVDNLEQYNQNNKFVPSKDMIKILTYIFQDIDIFEQDKLIDIISKNNKQYITAREMLKSYFLQPYNYYDIGMMNPLEGVGGIIQKIALYGNIQIGFPDHLVENVYVCNSDMFNNGVFKEIDAQTYIIKKFCKGVGGSEALKPSTYAFFKDAAEYVIQKDEGNQDMAQIVLNLKN